MGELPTISFPIPSTTEPLLCPNCGYDLRQTPGDLCSECGHTIDRANLATSNFPWPHRRHRGRITTLLQTIWLITINSNHIRYESARTQLLHDGRSFRRIIAAIVAISLICVVLMLAIGYGGLHFLAVTPPTRPSIFSAMRINFTWFQDLAIPWSTAATMLPTWPLMLTLLSLYLTSAHQRLFQLKNISATAQESASTIAFYAIAPLAWLFPLSLLWCTTFYFVHARILVATWMDILEGSLPFAALLILILTITRITQWNLRLAHRGSEHSLLLIPKLLPLYLLGLILFLGILPWCIGFIWIVIDSFR